MEQPETGYRLMLEGELTFLRISSWLPIIKQSLETSYTQVILDFSQVARVDNAGLGMVMSMVHYAQQRGKQLSCAKVPQEMHDLMKLVGITPFVTILEHN